MTIYTTNNKTTPGTIFAEHDKRATAPGRINNAGIGSIPEDVRGTQTKDEDSRVTTSLEGALCCGLSASRGKTVQKSLMF